MLKAILISTFFSSTIFQLSFGQSKGFLVTTDKVFLDAHAAPYNAAKPGDTLYILAGNRNYLLISNFQGNPDKPIVIINKGGQVTIDTDHYYGISIQNCRYIKFTGSGSTDNFYGFKILRVANGAGLGIGDLSSDFEIDHVSISNCKIAGLYAKTDPDCTGNTVRGIFTQYNTNIHDNYISDVSDEGLYVGSSKYLGQNVTCNGSSVLLMPSLLDGVRVYNNIIVRPGWDGIQVSSASNNCQIYGNTVLYDSQDGTDSQASGILIGGGSKCDCFNNYIAYGKGDGIESLGLGGYKIYNNVIVDQGLSFFPDDKTKMTHGIFVSDNSVIQDSSFYIMHNDIINPKSDGIRFSSLKSKGSIIASNVIINPGNFDYYENGGTSFHGVDSYVMLQEPGAKLTIKNNYFNRNITTAGFDGTDTQSANYFKLKWSSPLIDMAATDPLVAVKFDFLHNPRPYGTKSDIGAFELDAATFVDQSGNGFYRQGKLLKNPVSDVLQISITTDNEEDLNLQIFNIQGVLVSQPIQSNVLVGNNMIEANVSNLSTGVYFYLIHSKKYISSGKFLIFKK